MLTDHLSNHVDEYQLGQVECSLATFSAQNRKISFAFLQSIGRYHELVATKVIRAAVAFVVEMYCDYSLGYSNQRLSAICPSRVNYPYRGK